MTGEIFGKPTKIDRVSICRLRQHLRKEILEDAKELIEFAEYAYSLAYDEEPNYAKIRFLLSKVLLDKGLVPSDDFDWNKRETICSKVHILD